MICKVLVGELVKERDAAAELRALELEASRTTEGETVQEKLIREKEERKQQALERSKQRQADKAYFEARKKANEDHKPKTLENKNELTNNSETDLKELDVSQTVEGEVEP